MKSGKTLLFVCSATIGSLGFLLGCAQTTQARATALSGDDSAVRLTPQSEGRYNVHELDVQNQGTGSVVTGHVGPAIREPHRPDGHVDVQVVGPDGQVVADGSSRLEPVNASPRVPVERRFRVEVPSQVPPGSEVKVHYHGTAEPCHP